MQSQSDIPRGYVDLLRQFTIAVLRAQPHDVVSFAADYFSHLKNISKKNCDEYTKTIVLHPPIHSSDVPGVTVLTPIVLLRNKSTNNEDERKKVSSKSTSMNFSFEIMHQKSDDLSDKADISLPNGTRYRRPSVAAEPYDPDQSNEVSEVSQPSTHQKTDEQLDLLRAVCKKVILFRHMDEVELDQVIHAMFDRQVNEGDRIIVQGDDGDYFYVIEKGDYEVHVYDDKGLEKKVFAYKDEGCFGEMALMYNAPRSATVIARSEGRIWCMGRNDFRKLVLSHASKQRRAFIKLLHSVEILQILSPYERMNLADALEKRTYADGECIVHEGEPGLEMFFIMSGKVTVTKSDLSVNVGSVKVSELGEGQYFGELALLSEQARAASVYAVGRTVLAVLDVHSFERLLGPCVALMKRNTSKYAPPASYK